MKQNVQVSLRVYGYVLAQFWYLSSGRQINVNILFIFFLLHNFFRSKIKNILLWYFIFHTYIPQLLGLWKVWHSHFSLPSGSLSKLLIIPLNETAYNCLPSTSRWSHQRHNPFGLSRNSLDINRIAEHALNINENVVQLFCLFRSLHGIMANPVRN